MSPSPQRAGSFAAPDYVVFALMLAMSAAVGVYFAWTDRGQRNTRDFLMGGRKLTALPVSLSLTASFMSAITMLSHPAEVSFPKEDLFQLIQNMIRASRFLRRCIALEPILGCLRWPMY